MRDRGIAEIVVGRHALNTSHLRRCDLNAEPKSNVSVVRSHFPSITWPLKFLDEYMLDHRLEFRDVGLIRVQHNERLITRQHQIDNITRFQIVNVRGCRIDRYPCQSSTVTLTSKLSLITSNVE